MCESPLNGLEKIRKEAIVNSLKVPYHYNNVPDVTEGSHEVRSQISRSVFQESNPIPPEYETFNHCTSSGV